MPSVYAACCGVRTFGDDKEDCARTRSHAYHCHRQPRVAMPPLSARPPPAFGRECECERVCACVVMAMWRSAVYVCVCSMYTRVYTMQRTAPQSTTNSDTNTFKRTRIFISPRIRSLSPIHRSVSRRSPSRSVWCTRSPALSRSLSVSFSVGDHLHTERTHEMSTLARPLRIIQDLPATAAAAAAVAAVLRRSRSRFGCYCCPLC